MTPAELQALHKRIADLELSVSQLAQTVGEVLRVSLRTERKVDDARGFGVQARRHNQRY